MELELTDRELLVEEVRTLAETVKEPTSRARYAELQSALAAGDVPEPLLGSLQNVITLGLKTGRVRKLHGAQAESAFLRLFAKMPMGRALAESTSEVNRALDALKGQTIERIAFTPHGPGVFALAIDTESYRLNLEIHEEGIWLREVGLDV